MMMFSEKSFKILYDLKYQLARLKANQADWREFIEQNKEKIENGKADEKVIERYNAYQAILAMYNPDTFDFTDKPLQRVNCVHTIITVGQLLKPNIEESLYKKLNIDSAKPEHAFDFSYQFMPGEVINFLKEEMSAQEKEIYER